jgi:diguanylate cyclase (GGDEF)-like protein
MGLADQRREFRHRIARQDISRVALWSGAVVMLLALTNAVRTGLVAGALELNLPVGLALVVLSFAVRSPRFPASAVSPVFALVVVALTASLAYQASVFHWPVDLGYVIVVMSVFGPVVLDALSFAVGMPVLLAIYVVGTHDVVGERWVDWAFVGVAAAVASGALLRMRLTALDAQADAARAVEEMATTDALTGVLNRRGLDLVLPRVLSSSARFDSTVYVCFVDVDGLKSANDTYGHDFGDQVLQNVARALEGSIRVGDVLARWGGDEFVIVGLGTATSCELIESRIREHVRDCGIDPAKWPGVVSTGCAGGAADPDSIAALISRADQDMYRRRAERRSP